MIDGLLQLLSAAIWLILPAYVANAAPVVLGGGKPIDGGRKFTDGRPILGPGKTIRGLIAGLIAGSIFGALQGVAVGQIYFYLSYGFLLALGTLTGDLLGSFIKRRINLSRGAAAPGLDQLGFVLLALLFASPLFVPDLEVILTILIITPPIHLSTNFIGHKLKLKDRPY
ncbi:MAG: CDP-2,3-bis-(O-geranylgeranyl)-sn-glycerol synthase [Methanobacteriota archaeon]